MKFLFAVCFLLASFLSLAQADTTTPLYKRFPTLPPLQLVAADSLTKFTTENIPRNKKVLILFFSPDCEHCQHEAQELVAHKEDFKDKYIVMVSTYPFYRLREFGEAYGLNVLNNVVITKDPYYFLLTFYNIRSLPYLALYNKKGKLIDTFQGTVAMDTILASFNAH